LEELNAKGLKEKKAIFRAIASGLKKRRGFHDVNLLHIEKKSKANQTVVVPGKVLGKGRVTKKVNVAALSFSASAKESIEKAGGKTMTIQEFATNVPKGAKILG